VARRAELAVDAGGGELAEQVFVEIALGVALIERQIVDESRALLRSEGFWIMSMASCM
jgi:hypothetical protein